jgi:hypothetical protein
VPITEFPAGGLGAGFAPEEWAAYVLDNLSAASVLLASGATEIRTTAKAVHAPRFTGQASTAWYGELDPIAEGAPPGDELVLTPKKVATLATFSNEVVADSNANVLDSVGQKMVRSVALEADRAMFAGTGGDQPTGILNITPALPSHIGAVDYAGIVTASGLVRAAGGTPNVVYLNPADYTTLQLATGQDNRPLITGETMAGAPPVIAGLLVFPTPAVPGAVAVVAQADQIVAAVREDASVAVSDQSAFDQDGTQVRVVARVDVGVNDPDGLCVISAAVGRDKDVALRHVASQDDDLGLAYRDRRDMQPKGPALAGLPIRARLGVSAEAEIADHPPNLDLARRPAVVENCQSNLVPRLVHDDLNAEFRPRTASSVAPDAKDGGPRRERGQGGKDRARYLRPLRCVP